MTEAEDKAQLKEVGREIAQGLMAQAVHQADDNAMMSRQIYVLRYVAHHILATYVYNLVEQKNGDADDAIGAMLEELKSEYELVEQQDMQMLTTSQARDSLQ